MPIWLSFFYNLRSYFEDLLVKDLEVLGVKDHVIKYFCNYHLPSAWYKLAGDKKLVLPQVVRWNTLAACLESYLRNWPILFQVCEEHRENIDKDITKSGITHLSLKRGVEDYLQILNLYPSHLTKFSPKFVWSVKSWTNGYRFFRVELVLVQKSIRKSWEKNADGIVWHLNYHLLANILDPRYYGENQTV